MSSNDVPMCPICISALSNQEVQGERIYFDCPRCGKYILTRSILGATPWLNPNRTDLLSHSIRKMQNGKNVPILDSYLIEQILQGELPSLRDQLNNLIMWLGQHSNPGQKIVKSLEIFQAITGAKNTDSVLFILDHLKGSLITNDGAPVSPRIQLTVAGWEYFDKLNRGAIMSRRAFMAMKFGDPGLDRVFVEHFKPAVKATGFELYRLDEQPSAGLIDDRLRVEIRRSRFLIADLTYGNQGAYWEAGFAEGLGKPVIYTCEKSQFDVHKTHFDTNHHLTIIWDQANPRESEDKLKATIRATLPDEAILTDT